LAPILLKNKFNLTLKKPTKKKKESWKLKIKLEIIFIHRHPLWFDPSKQIVNPSLPLPHL
jgi:hypothetical protein